MNNFNEIKNRIEANMNEIEGNETINGTTGNDNLSGGLNDTTIFGQDGDDVLSGGTSNNNLNGEAGNDTLSGGSGDNTLTGGIDNDVLSGGSGNNNLNGEAGNDTLSGGSGDNTLTGGIGNDILTSGSGNDELDGGEDNDYLAGGVGNNTLRGGTGTDNFFFADVEYLGEGEEPINEIVDFNSSEGDKISIDANSFEVTPGDTSVLAFDNTTSILSVAGEQAVRVLSGVDSDILANTEIIENDNAVNGDFVAEDYEIIIGDDVIAEDVSVAVGGDGGDGINNSNGNDGNDAVAEDGEVVIGEDGTDGINDNQTSIYRFFESEGGFHFYTSSEEEKNALEQQIENGEVSYIYEGESFTALAEDDDGDPLTGAKPVYRFFDNLTGAHLYTISETEKDNIVNNLPDYNLEGVAYYAYDEPQGNTIPLYRLYNNETGTRLFTSSVTEKDNVLETLPQYTTEGEAGIAFHVLPLEI